MSTHVNYTTAKKEYHCSVCNQIINPCDKYIRVTDVGKFGGYYYPIYCLNCATKINIPVTQEELDKLPENIATSIANNRKGTRS